MKKDKYSVSLLKSDLKIELRKLKNNNLKDIDFKISDVKEYAEMKKKKKEFLKNISEQITNKTYEKFYLTKR